MILGIDIGGTKTLIAKFSDTGEITKEVAFSTPQDYDAFITELGEKARTLLSDQSQSVTVCAGVPGLLNRKAGVVQSLGNLPWENKPIAQDIKSVLNVQKVIIENDAKLAGLSEVTLLKSVPERALYLTISTGIGGALLVNGKLSSDMIDMELGKTPLNFEGKLQHWEEFASGRTFVDAYGTTGDDTHDPTVWESYVKDRLGPGLATACSFLQVDTVIFGGGLGHHSARFSEYIGPYLEKYLHSIVRRPTNYRSARHGRNAVIYGCYIHASAQS